MSRVLRRAWLAALTLAQAGCATREEPSAAAPTDTCVRSDVGRVQLIVDAEPIVQSRATAQFVELTASSSAPKCTTRVLAGCAVTECVRAEPPPGLACQRTEVITSAGALTVSGGASPPLTMSADGQRA